jgi:hypothetical protein
MASCSLFRLARTTFFVSACTGLCQPASGRSSINSNTGSVGRWLRPLPALSGAPGYPE